MRHMLVISHRSQSSIRTCNGTYIAIDLDFKWYIYRHRSELEMVHILPTAMDIKKDSRSSASGAQAAAATLRCRGPSHEPIVN